MYSTESEAMFTQSKHLAFLVKIKLMQEWTEINSFYVV